VITTPSERRRAEEFAARLEGRPEPSGTGENAPLLELSARLRAMEFGADVDPLFRDRLRTRLLAVASVQGIGGESADRPTRRERHHQPQATNRVPRRIALAASTVTAVVALSGISMASGGANPGDTLYSVKRSREAAQLALARSESSRGQLLLQFARTRLVEAITVRDDPAELARALDDMDANTRAGMTQLSAAAMDNADRIPLDIADEFVAVQRRQLITGLIVALPQDRRARSLDSLSLLERVKARSAKLRPGLQCNAHFAGIPKTDELGVIPRACSSAPRGVTPGVTPEASFPPVAPGGPDKRSTPQTRPGVTSPSPRAIGPQHGGGPDPSASPVPTGQPEAAGSDPSPAPSGTQAVLGSVTSTVGGAVGGVVGPLSGEPPVPILP
jgi:hypothetical protein